MVQVSNPKQEITGLAASGMPRVKTRSFGLVRDANGKPKIDGDPKDLHPAIQALLTPQERIEMGIATDADRKGTGSG